VRGLGLLNTSSRSNFAVHSLLSGSLVLVIVRRQGGSPILGSKVGSDRTEGLTFLEIER
jgi:hypothetical protein